MTLPGTWEEAIEMANQEEKIIFVDAFTTWCGPCKRMSKLVFTDESVGQFYNRHFIKMLFFGYLILYNPYIFFFPEYLLQGSKRIFWQR